MKRVGLETSGMLDQRVLRARADFPTGENLV